MTETIRNKMVRFAGKSTLITLVSSSVLYGALHCSLTSSEKRTPQKEKTDKQNPTYKLYSEKLFSNRSQSSQMETVRRL